MAGEISKEPDLWYRELSRATSISVGALFTKTAMVWHFLCFPGCDPTLRIITALTTFILSLPADVDRFTYFLSTCVPILEKFQVGLITFCFHVSYFGIDVRYIKFVLCYISAFLNDIFQEISSIIAWLNFKILWLSFDNINHWGDRLMQPSRMHYQHAIKENWIVMSFVRKTFYFLRFATMKPS